MAKTVKLNEPDVAIKQQTEETEVAHTVTLGGRTFRPREPMEWTPAEADRAIELAGEQMEQSIAGNSDSGDSKEDQRKQGVRMIAPLMKGGAYREFLALGLWEEQESGAPIPVTEQTRAQHAEFFRTLSIPFKSVNEAIPVAYKAFFG